MLAVPKLATGAAVNQASAVSDTPKHCGREKHVCDSSLLLVSMSVRIFLASFTFTAIVLTFHFNPHFLIFQSKNPRSVDHITQNVQEHSPSGGQSKYFQRLRQPLTSKEKAICTEKEVPLRDSQPKESAGCHSPYNKHGIELLCQEAIRTSCGLHLPAGRDRFYRKMEQLTAKCEPVTLGNFAAGGQWQFCMSGPYQPSPGSCLVYSFGIGNEWSFDDAISQQFGCEVHSFDPTMGATNHNRSSLITFHNLGLAGHGVQIRKFYKKGWKMMTLSEIMAFLGHKNRTIDILKIDVEYAEWDALEDALKSNALRNVKQLEIEIHVWTDNTQTYVRFHRIISALENAGFDKWLVYNKGHFIEAVNPDTGQPTKYDTQKDVGLLNRHFLEF